ncbi:MAG: hypothetical protein K2N94_11605, partial [Lachnospiraceae bacterium]|nr:hypothetical protein [Lachnospiraceae bacterium]
MKKRGISKNFFLLFFLAASYFVLYVLSTFHESYFAVGACGVIFLAAGYLFVSALERERREKEEEQRWQTEQIQKCLEETLQTQRAIHTAIRKANEAMGRQLKDMGGEASGEFAAEEQQKLLQRIAVVQERTISESKRLAEIQVNALKAVAKYNKENARQLALNANENANRIADSVFHIAADLGQRLDGAFERLAERSSVIRAEGMTGSENGMSVLPEASVMPEQEMTEEAEMAKMSALEPTVDPTEEPTGEL